MHPHIHCTLSLFPSVESSESLYHRLPLGMSRKCMCGGDDHQCFKTGPVMFTVHGSRFTIRF